MRGCAAIKKIRQNGKVIHLLERFFYWWGCRVASLPWAFILGSAPGDGVLLPRTAELHLGGRRLVVLAAGGEPPQSSAGAADALVELCCFNFETFKLNQILTH